MRSAGSGYNVLMNKKLQDYIKYIEKESEKPSKELQEYHKTMVQQFQHERLIHLIVTLFFALFMIFQLENGVQKLEEITKKLYGRK